MRPCEEFGRFLIFSKIKILPVPYFLILGRVVNNTEELMRISKYVAFDAKMHVKYLFKKNMNWGRCTRLVHGL